MAQKKEQARKNGVSSQSSDKLLQILECLAEYRAPAKLQDIAQRLDMPQPTALRYLNSLIQQDYAYKDEEAARYAISWKICRLGYMVTSNSGIRDIVSGFLRELAYQFDLGACLVVQREGELLYLDLVDRPGSMLRSVQRIGNNAPMHSTASGKVLLASLTDQQVGDIIADKGLPALTDRTITDPNTLFAQLGQVRAEGHAFDDEECEQNIRCISAPLYDYTDSVIAAISLFGDVARMSEAAIQNDLLPELLQKSRVISTRLGYVCKC